MKNTIASVALFVFLTFLFSNRTMAFLPPIDDLSDKIKIQIELPTATPTPIVFKKIEPVVTFKLIPTLGSKLTVTPTQEESEINPSTIASKSEEKVEEKTDLKIWFLNITLGLLLLIIIIQLWSKKKEDQ